MPVVRWSPGTRAQLAAALLAVVCYLGALANGFAWDDVFIVQNSELIHRWATVPSALHLAYWYNSDHLYRPLTTLSFALDWLLLGGSPAVYHAVNIAWHALASALVARLALRWWSPLSAALAGSLFAVQPVHVEAVANIVGRSELMCAAALLALTLIATRTLPAGMDRTPRDRIVMIGVLAAIATASKETGVVSPVIAWAAAWITANRARRDGQPVAVRTTVEATVAACLGVLFELAVRLHALGGLGADRPHPAFRMSTAWQSTTLALATLPRAVALVIAPARPRPDYSPTEASILHPSVALVVVGVLLAGAAIAMLVAHARRPTPWTMAAVYASATFAPVSNLVIRSGVVLAERTLYSPSVGAALVSGATLAAVWKSRPRLAVATACLMALLSITFTIQAIPIWHDTVTVFEAMRVRGPTSYRGYALSAEVRDGSGDHATAHQYFAHAIELYPRDPNVLDPAGVNALVVGDTADAITWLESALQFDADRPSARTTLAGLLLRRGDTARADPLLRDGLRLDPTQQTWRQMLESVGASANPTHVAMPAPASESTPRSH